MYAMQLPQSHSQMDGFLSSISVLHIMAQPITRQYDICLSRNVDRQCIQHIVMTVRRLETPLKVRMRSKTVC